MRINEEENNHPKIDLKDKKILYLLSEEGRIPLSLIAKKIRLGKDTVRYRIERMIQKGIIEQFYPELNFKLLGYRVHRIFMLLDENEHSKYPELLKYLINHPHTRGVMEYSDKWDIEWKLIAWSLDEFEQIKSELMNRFSRLILDKISVPTVDTYYSSILPYEFPTLLVREGKKPVMISKQTPDELDLKILRQLSIDARQSTYDIANNVPLSPDAIGLRIKRLLTSGIIRNFTILPNFSRLRHSWTTCAIDLRLLTQAQEQKLREFVLHHPQIVKADKTSGIFDIILYIIADDSRIFHKTVKQIKAEFGMIMRNYETFPAYKEHFFSPMPKILDKVRN